MDLSFDHHVHCGQYENNYYQPAYVIQALKANGVNKLWLSSTTSNIGWCNKKEKLALINHIEAELEEALAVGANENVEVFPFYWVIPQRFHEGEKIADIMHQFPYYGFKIHPRMIGWELFRNDENKLMVDICDYAASQNMPILIHTGVDPIDDPDRFENFYASYPDVEFILAHCRKPEAIIRLLSKYNNLKGDCALCPLQSLKTIQSAGIGDRIYFGSDFPITFWHESEENDIRTILYEELYDHYHRLLLQYK